MSKLIIIRGNSGSGKTTIAKDLQRKFGRNTMLISQDYIRREMLLVRDKKNNKAIPLLIELLKYGKNNSNVVILEGILYTDLYMLLFEKAIELFGSEIYAYYYDIPFEETIKRHNTKSNKSDFGEKEMKNWWREKDYVGFINEKELTATLSISEAVSKIYLEVSSINRRHNNTS